MSDNENDDATEDVPIDEIHAVDPASHGSSTWKVLGEIDAQDGTGVLGHNTATTGAATGVAGVTDSSANDAAGVMGTATATTGQSSGVVGVTNAAESQATGVHGSAPGGAVTYGVRGDSTAQNGRGVVGFATSQGYSHSIPTQLGAGVMGVTDRSSSDSLLSEGIGVLGWTTAGGETRVEWWAATRTPPMGSV